MFIVKHIRRAPMAPFAFFAFLRAAALKGGKPWIGFCFCLPGVPMPEPIPQKDEVKDIGWIKKEELKKIFESTPEKVFYFGSWRSGLLF